MSGGGALLLPPAADMAFDASALRPIQGEDEVYDPSEMRPARAPSFMYVLGARGGTAREAAEWWLSDKLHYFGKAPRAHYAWLEKHALEMDGGSSGGRCPPRTRGGTRCGAPWTCALWRLDGRA